MIETQPLNGNFVTRGRCPACHATDFETLYQNRYSEPPIRDYLEWFYSSQGGVDFEYLQDADFTLCECSSCNLIFHESILNDATMEVLYEKWIDPQQALEQKTSANDLGLYMDHAREIPALIAYFEKLPADLSFFDFGMGWGEWALMAKGFGCKSSGTDLSEERIAFARSNGINILTWDELPDHEFDFINTEQVFEHIPDPLGTLRHLSQCLKEGGIVKISVPSSSGIERRMKTQDWMAEKHTRNSLNAVAPLEHINCFRRSSITQMGLAAGMEEVKMPMALQWAYSSEWRGPKKVVKNVLRPLYRNMLKANNCVFLRNA
ncbi:MAG: class I SAM-dependent methyltransferase [Rubripirellula sp.]